VPSIAGGSGAATAPAEAKELDARPEQKPAPARSDFSGTGGVISPERAEAVELTNDEILRYSRHLILPEVNMDGQKKLKAAKVLLVGTGGLGSPLALYLAAAGVGTLGLVDFDVVDYTNLQRQIVHGTKGRGTLEDRFRKRCHCGHQPQRRGHRTQRDVYVGQRDGHREAL